MKPSNRPVRTTIFFGLICGLLFIPVRMFFEYTVLWPLVFRLTIFAFVAAYSFILASWAGRRRVSVLFPLLFLFLFTFGQSSSATFLLLSLGMLSWIRSGICFGKAFVRSLGAEIVFSIGGGALVAYFNPQGALTWALGIWMFFLIQSLYFMVMTDLAETDAAAPGDPFEQARMKAEGILRS